jgi:hypothetical protein
MAGGTRDVGYEGASGGGSNYHFTWSAGGGVIYMRGADGNVGQLRYQLDGDALVTVNAGGKRTTYRRVG